MTRDIFEMIEIDVPKCSRTYGVAPCAAILGTTGVRKCYNTRATCQDAPNFSLGTPITHRFCKPGAIPKGLLAFPTLQSVSQSSPAMNVVGSQDTSGGLGRRGTLDFKIGDFPYHERGFDPYQSERVSGVAQTDEGGYKPEDRGLYLTKLKARWPNYDGAEVRLVRGYIANGLLTDTTTYRYFLQKLDGPSDGVLSGSALDVFAFLDTKKALAPKPSTGLLLADLSAVATSFALTPAGVGTTYPASGLVCIGSEVMTFTRSGDTMTVARGQRGTTAATHSAGDTVQETLSFRKTRIDDVVNTLFTGFTSAPAAYLDYAAWQYEVQRWAPSLALTTDICTPTPVATLLAELSFLGANIVPDERAAKIRLRMNRPVDGETVYSTDDRSMKALAQEDRDEDRITQVLYHSSRIDPTKTLEDESNYARKMLTVNPRAVALFGAAKTRKVFTRWLDGGDDVVVAIESWRILRRFERAPKRVRVTIDARDKAIGLLDVVNLSSDDLADETGKPVSAQFQVVRRTEPVAYHDVEVMLQALEFTGRYGFVAPNSTPVYGLATPAQKARYGFISGPSEIFPDGTQSYKAI